MEFCKLVHQYKWSALLGKWAMTHDCQCGAKAEGEWA